MSDDRVEAEKIARLFHETYEELAPSFGYETRKESAVPWEQVPENNRNLMIAVAARVAGVLSNALDPSIESLQAEVERLREALEIFARCPTHGKHGGPFVIANAVYEDMCNGDSAPREAYWHASDFEKARQALAAKERTRDR